MGGGRKKVLVGTLSCGENEYPLCLESLRKQQSVSFDHFTVENLPNKEAHDTLYRKFMEARDSYDYFLKLDADMALRGNNALQILIDLISSRGAAGLMLYVMDWPSQLAIPGIVMFRSDCRWLGSEEKLNVDYPPQIRGELIRIGDVLIVDHMPCPTNFQMFRYGLHKAFKCLQPDRRDKQTEKGLIHSTILTGIARHWRQTRDLRLIWTLLAAMMTFEGRMKTLLHDYAGIKARSSSTALLRIENGF